MALLTRIVAPSMRLFTSQTLNGKPTLRETELQPLACSHNGTFLGDGIKVSLIPRRVV